MLKNLDFFEQKNKNLFNFFIKEIDFVVSHINDFNFEKANEICDKSFYLISEFISSNINEQEFDSLSLEEKSNLIENIINKYKKQLKEEKELFLIQIISYIIINKSVFYNLFLNPNNITPLNLLGVKYSEQKFLNNLKEDKNLIKNYEAEEKQVFLKGAYSPVFIFFESVKQLVGEEEITFNGELDSFALAKNKMLYLENFE